MNVIITGGAGFIGSNFVRHLLRNDDANLAVWVVDALTYAGNLHNLAEVKSDPRLHFVKASIADVSRMAEMISRIRPDIIVNFAAESHVDRSITDSRSFISTNVLGVHTLLEAVRHANIAIQKFVQISTDEVYGSLGHNGQFHIDSPIRPSSPYSASKASGDLVALSYFHTYQTPVVVLRCSNNYGPFQFPEKMIPLMVTRALKGQSLPVYGNGQNVRDWIHVTDFCRGIEIAMTQGPAGKIFHFGGASERQNIDVVSQIIAKTGTSPTLVSFVEDRKGHDFRYAIDYSQTTQILGWHPTIQFEVGLSETISWYQSNVNWWESILTGTYALAENDWDLAL